MLRVGYFDKDQSVFDDLCFLQFRDFLCKIGFFGNVLGFVVAFVRDLLQKGKNELAFDKSRCSQ